MLNDNRSLLRAACVLVLALGAATVAKEAAAKTPAEQLATLKADYAKDHEATIKTIKDPKTGEVIERQLIGTVSADKYLPALLELGKSDDEATAASALSMAVVTWADDKRAAEGLELLFKRFVGSPRMADFAREQASHFYPGQDKHLERVIAEAKDPAAVALALLKLGNLHDENFVPNDRKLNAEQADKRRGKAIELYRRVVTDFAHIEGSFPANTARRCITALQQLRTGKEAPAIDGNDLAGKRMTLAEFRGKVVVLDFWGSWCGPCIAALPMLKDVAAKYDPKDVVLLGVMSEQRAEDATKIVAEKSVTWRNWLDLQGDNGESPIVKAWGISDFPRTFVIDRKGKIRFTGMDSREELQNAVDALLAEKPAK